MGRNDTQGDVLHGGPGNDTFKTRDGEADVIDCGPGVDTALIDFKDVLVEPRASARSSTARDGRRRAKTSRRARSRPTRSARRSSERRPGG